MTAISDEISLERRIARRALKIGIPLSVIVYGVFATLDFIFGPKWTQFGDRFWAWQFYAFASVLIGMGLASLLSLFVSNRHRMRAVLRPNFGRLLCCILLTIFAPYTTVFRLFPASILFSHAVNSVPLYTIILLTFMHYVTSSLIISGVKNRFVRVALFGQVWISWYAWAFIYTGNHIISL